jgi:hypothetical protein
MRQSPFDHLVSQPVGVLTNRRTGRELMLFPPVRLDLLANVFVKMTEPFIRHLFHTHHHPLLVPNAAVLVRSLASPRHPSSTGLSRMKLSRCDRRSRIRTSAPRYRVHRPRHEPIPSCACRQDTSAVQLWKSSYASPCTRENRTRFSRIVLSGSRHWKEKICIGRK